MIKAIIISGIGAGIGFIVGYTMRRCGASGCPITCTPWGAMIFGAVMGLILAIGPGKDAQFKLPSSENEGNNTETHESSVENEESNTQDNGS